MRRLRLVEERLQKLDAKQAELERSWSVRKRGQLAVTYETENPFVVSALPTGVRPERVDLRSFKSNSIVGAQQRQLRTVKRLTDTSVPAPTQQAFNSHYQMVMAQQDDDQFAELFEAAATREPGSLGASKEENELEDAMENRAIRRTVSSDAQRSHTGGFPPVGSEFEATESARQQSPTLSPLRKKNSKIAGSNPASSPYINPRPVQVLRAQLKSAKVRHINDEARKRRFLVAPTGEAARMTAHFFATLPPVIPPHAVPLMAKEVRRPETAPTQRQNENAQSSEAQRIERLLRLSQRMADNAIYSKEFYFLNVRIVNTPARLTEWQFSVVVTDVTNPARLLRHSFKNLNVNANMCIVFHPPSNVILSPADDIPWVGAPQSLFMHTLRIEVFSTFPFHSKIVDSMVFFGDVLPNESHIGTQKQ